MSFTHTHAHTKETKPKTKRYNKKIRRRKVQVHSHALFGVWLPEVKHWKVVIKTESKWMSEIEREREWLCMFVICVDLSAYNRDRCEPCCYSHSVDIMSDAQRKMQEDELRKIDWKQPRNCALSVVMRLYCEEWLSFVYAWNAKLNFWPSAIARLYKLMMDFTFVVVQLITNQMKKKYQKQTKKLNSNQESRIQL